MSWQRSASSLAAVTVALGLLVAFASSAAAQQATISGQVTARGSNLPVTQAEDNNPNFNGCTNRDA
jgi:hypothetical protein